MLLSIFLCAQAWLATLVVSQYFPPVPEGLEHIRSKFHPGVSISFKEPEICETSPGVKSYSGYVHLPPGFLDGESQVYPMNTFFWFFESRKDPENAPLSIWMNGGPGGSSAAGLLQENGPCFVGNDSNSTFLNPWSWNNEVNMLYIDQPLQVGYSYDILTNVTVDIMSTNVTVSDFSEGVPAQNNTLLVGTRSSQSETSTANTTAHAAHALWHFAQIWFEVFPYYKPHDEKVSIWTESYGGHYGPAAMALFEEQNQKIDNGTIRGPGAHHIKLDTLGIVNGCVDQLIQAPFYPRFANNNTYGIMAMNESTYHEAIHNWERTGGVRDSILRCRQLVADPEHDSEHHRKRVADACSKAGNYAEEALESPYIKLSQRGWFDITHPSQDPFPDPYFLGFLNQHWVQRALGVPINHTFASNTVYEAFQKTGDISRPGFLEDIGHVLDQGIKVALMHGDRDFACNWAGGEEISLRINYTSSSKFRDSGYESIQTNASYVGGQVRHYGNLSFSRVYQAGHEVPSYQPETAYQVFMRSTLGKDIATGLVAISPTYNTTGPPSTWHIKNEVLPAPEPVCYILGAGDKCTEERWALVKNNTAIVKDFIVVGREDESEAPQGNVLNENPVQILGDQQLPLSDPV